MTDLVPVPKKPLKSGHVRPVEPEPEVDWDAVLDDVRRGLQEDFDRTVLYGIHPTKPSPPLPPQMIILGDRCPHERPILRVELATANKGPVVWVGPCPHCDGAKYIDVKFTVVNDKTGQVYQEPYGRDVFPPLPQPQSFVKGAETT